MIEEFGEVLEKENLRKYSTLGIGGTCKYLVKPDSLVHLIGLINYLNNKEIKYYVLGNCSNVIIDDTYFDGVIIKLDNFNNIDFEDNKVTVGAGVSLGLLNSKALENGYTNLSPFAGIPGNVGGSVVGNAGCYNHEIMENIISVKVIDKDGNVKDIPKNDISFGYRYTTLKDKYIVLEATFLLEKGDIEETKKEMKERAEKRIASQPLDKRNCGSIFRNPEGYSSGKLIDDLDLKGYQIGGAKISEKHANFIVNENNATFNDVINLIDYIKREVQKKYDITLVVEPTIIRWN